MLCSLTQTFFVGKSNFSLITFSKVNEVDGVDVETLFDFIGPPVAERFVLTFGGQTFDTDVGGEENSVTATAVEGQLKFNLGTIAGLVSNTEPEPVTLIVYYEGDPVGEVIVSASDKKLKFKITD